MVARERAAAAEAVEEPGVNELGTVRVLAVAKELQVAELVVLPIAVNVVDVFVGE
jgi:hypothetical protein